jgi:hypothetical protein
MVQYGVIFSIWQDTDNTPEAQLEGDGGPD